MRRLALAVPLTLVACGGDPAPLSGGPDPHAELAVARARCTACHGASGGAAARLGALPAPSLRGIGGRAARPWLEAFLASHFADGPDEARDLADFVCGWSGAAGLSTAGIGASEVDRGERLWGEAGCAACHAPTGSAADDGVAGLADKTDLDHVVAFLRDPRATRPDLRAHDFGLEVGDARALAAWLLRGRLVDAADAPPSPGLAWECFELQITDAGLPVLDGVAPKAKGTATVIDVAPRTRDDNFALRFSGSVSVPESGEWTFVTGSDDSSWLFVDGAMVVSNEGLAPHRRREGRVRLDAGSHELTVVYTEAGGQQSLEVLWQGPGVERGPIPAAALSARTVALRAPVSDATIEPERVRRGERAFVARRCAACHDADDMPAPAASPAWSAVLASTASCPLVPAPVDAVPALRPSPDAPRPPVDELRFRMARDGCLSCHARDGAGGMAEPARARLVEVEDLGEEGRVPPDLSKVGHRLRASWIEAVLRGERDARTYVRARMPRVSASDAADYARLFEAVDAVSGDEVEPAFSTEAAAEGRRIAGAGGFACIACHRVAGHASIGPQGMDLALQYERVRPGWFREWLLAPAAHRPGTRMPSFWPVRSEAAIAQIDAVRVWLSLGNAMPLPKGIAGAGSQFVLEVDGDRPRLHGAFLKDLSARCIAVGTPERTHYAYDLAHQRLAWLWRGAFLDAQGTWSGRAGQLLSPLGEDWVVLPDGCPFEPVDGAAAPRMLGFALDADGYPIWRVGLGPVVVEDRPRPRWTDGGSELVRTVTARGGSVRMRLPAPDGPVRAFVGGAAVSEVRVDDGARLEVVYRW